MWISFLIQQIGLAFWRKEPDHSAAAMAATGMETTTASAHFQSRRGGQRRKWVKLSTLILCGSLIPLSLVADMGPNNDKCQAGVPEVVYADAGYDAEWVQVQCREEWGVESVIKPAVHRADGQLGGLWRSGMNERYLKQKGYGRRWAVESFFSGLKRTMGATLSSRTPQTTAGGSRFQGVGPHPQTVRELKLRECFQQSNLESVPPVKQISISSKKEKQ